MWHCMRRNILRAFRSTVQSCVVIGGFLTALVLYETITGEPADLVTPSFMTATVLFFLHLIHTMASVLCLKEGDSRLRGNDVVSVWNNVLLCRNVAVVSGKNEDDDLTFALL